MKPLTPLDGETKANLYLQLAQLDRAGIAPLQALPKVQVKGVEPRIKRVLRQLDGGRPLSEAGRAAGIFDAFDSAAIAAGEQSGNYPFAQLAELHRLRARRRAKVRSRLWLPLGVLLLALVVRPLPALIGGSLGAGGYLIQSLGLFMLLLALFWGLSRLPRLARHWGLAEPWDGAVLAIPVVGSLVRRRDMLEFARALGLLSRAGAPMFEAMPAARGVVTNRRLRDRLGFVEEALHQGATVTDALARSPDFDGSLLAFAGSGEQAGAIDTMLLHYVRLEEEQLNDAEDRLATWVPRLIYLAVAIWMAATILSAGAPGSLDVLKDLER